MSDFDDLVAQLKQRRDELRVKAHLASREIQDEWEELEQKAEDFFAQAGLDKTSEGVGKALSQLGQELKLGYDRVRDAIKDD